MPRWPDTATALQTSSPCPLSWVRLPLVLPGILTIFPDLWVGLTALRVRFTPVTQPGDQPEQTQRHGSRVSGPGFLGGRSLPITCWTLITNLWVLEGSWREMTPHSHPHGKQGS